MQEPWHETQAPADRDPSLYNYLCCSVSNNSATQTKATDSVQEHKPSFG